MNKECTLYNSKNIANQFIWRGKGGDCYIVSEMKTTHLFYTLRMIWNHSMPDELKIKPYNKYSFSPFYTKEYIRDAINKIGIELSKRNDLPDNLKIELQFMANTFNKHKLLLDR